MIFRIKWGDLLPLLDKRFSTEKESITPPLYYEDEKSLFVYIETSKGNLWCSSIEKNKLDIEGFKLQHLTNAIELTELIKNNTLVIKQE